VYRLMTSILSCSLLVQSSAETGWLYAISAKYMTDLKNKLYVASEAICEICAAPVSYLEFLDQPVKNTLVCKGIPCRQMVSRKESNPNEYKFRVATYKKAIAIRKARMAFIDKIETNEFLENKSILQSVLETPLGDLKRPAHVVYVPTGLSKMHRLSEERIEIYKAHLTTIIEEVYSGETSEESVILDKLAAERTAASPERSQDNPYLNAVREQLCGICKGGCCSIGGDKAFIFNYTIARVRDMLGDPSPEDLLELYMSHVSDQTVEGACINQTKTGCSLPRNLRSDICNTYFCPALSKLGGKIGRGHSPGTVLAVKRKNDLWNRFSEASENKVTEVWMVQDDQVEQLDYEPLVE